MIQKNTIMMHEKDALLSPCGQYRYALTRSWGPGPQALFIMLNPSTADARLDDPTIRRCIGFATREGCGSLRVENLYAWRATRPDEMLASAQPEGEADIHITAAARATDGPVIAAWGADARAAHRAASVLKMLLDLGITPVCLGMTKSGAPRHPLYVRKDAVLLPFGRIPETTA